MLKWAGVDPRRCVFLTDEPMQDPEHLVDRLPRVGTRTPPGLSVQDYPVPELASVDGPRLYVSEAERKQHQAWLASRGWSGRPLIVIQPGNHRSMGPKRDRWRRRNNDNKSWPLERWAQLLHRIHERRRDALLVLRGSIEEVGMLQEIKDVADLDAVVVIGHGVRELFAMCSAAHSMVSVDTGPAHVAAALNLPLAVLFGAESPLYWLPRTPSGSPVVGVGGPPQSNQADQVSVDALFNAWLSICERQKSMPT
jgi:heptosyltransferase-2/heptosyltransferase-3